MKRNLSFMFLLFASHAFALPCPTNSHLIYQGETLEHIRKHCGEPSAINTYQKQLSDVQKWVYFKTALEQKNAKIALLFKNNHVANIEIADVQNLAMAALCGTVIQVGMSTQSVAKACGKPMVQQNLKPDTITVTELKYSQPIATTLFFENGKFTDRK